MLTCQMMYNRQWTFHCPLSIMDDGCSMVHTDIYYTTYIYIYTYTHTPIYIYIYTNYGPHVKRWTTDAPRSRGVGLALKYRAYVCMYICMYLYIYIYIYTHIHTYICVYIYIYTHRTHISI